MTSSTLVLADARPPTIFTLASSTIVLAARRRRGSWRRRWRVWRGGCNIDSLCDARPLRCPLPLFLLHRDAPTAFHTSSTTTHAVRWALASGRVAAHRHCTSRLSTCRHGLRRKRGKQTHSSCVCSRGAAHALLPQCCPRAWQHRASSLCCFWQIATRPASLAL